MGAGIGLKSWVIPLYFAVGIIAKFYGRRAVPDDRSVVHLFLLLIFSLMLGIPSFVGSLIFISILVAGAIYTGRPNLPQPQLFRDRFEVLAYAMPLIIFIPVFSLSLFAGSFSFLSGFSFGEGIMWGILYFPSLAANDIVFFIRSRLRPELLPKN